MSFIFKIFSYIYYLFYRRFISSHLIFSSKEAKKTCIVGKNIKIYNNNVHVGKNVTLFDGVIIWGNGQVIISDGAKVGFNTIIYASEMGGGGSCRT